jgi:hypothetical protein
MIHYDLRCAEGHEFDGWFRSSTAFDQQAGGGLLDCPSCGSKTVSRALMAPRLSRGAAPPQTEALPQTASSTMSLSTPVTETGIAPAAPSSGLPAMPDAVRAVLQRLRTEVEKNCDYVGGRFAEEARSMHHGEQPHRPIYGETTPEQAERLAEDGIDVARIPWVPRADG